MASSSLIHGGTPVTVPRFTVFCMALCVSFVGSASFSVAAPQSLYVSLESGEDLASRDGSAASPFRTLGYAFERAGAPDGAELPAVTIHVGPGLHDESQESFPLRLPSGLTELTIEGSEGTIVDNPSTTSPTFELTSYPSPGELRIAVRNLTVRGGVTGVSCAAYGDQSTVAEIVGCTFEGQKERGVELHAGEESRGSLEIRNCVFGPTGAGVLVEGGRGAQMTFSVEECLFQELDSFGPGDVLGAAVDAHLDPAGLLAATIRRNVFRATSSAVLLSAAEFDGSAGEQGGQLDVQIVGNLMVGTDAADELRMWNAVYLSLWPHHDVSLTVASNTIVDVGGPVLFQDNLDLLREMDEIIPYIFVNNICRGTGAPSEFSSEFFSGFSPGIPVGDFPPPGAVIRNNLLEKSRLGLDEVAGNFVEDPQFVDPVAGDFHLLEGSPAVDEAAAEYAHLVSRDLDGNCRRVSRICRPDLDSYLMDLGAYELRGFCDEDVDVFTRGDCNRSEGPVDITDAIFVFNFLFLGAEAPAVPDACDSNDDGGLDITDGIFTLAYLFSGGGAPPPPFVNPGRDPSRDCLKSFR